jgi:flagellin
VSVDLNPSVRVALDVLRDTQANLTTTQRQVATGYRVGTAKDNATYWQIATRTRSDIGAVSAVQDALGLAQATVNVASTSVSTAVDIVTQIKAKLVTAEEASVDKTKLNDEITQLKEQLRSVGQSANFNGDNWVVLSGNADPSAPKQIPASIIRSADGTFSIGKLSYDGSISSTGPITISDARYLIDDRTSGSGGYGVLTSTAFAAKVGAGQNYVMLTNEGGSTTGQVEIALDSTTTNGQIDDMLSVVNAILGQMTNVGSAFGSLEARINMQDTLAKNMSDTLTSGVGKLVDANMEQESTKLAALQTQQQLGVQSLSIANASMTVITQLFQNIH